MKRFVACILLMLALYAFVACSSSDNDYEAYEPEQDLTAEVTTEATTPPQTEAAQNDEIPFMWLITSPQGQTMYIFGSIHAATPDLWPLPQTVMRAFARSDFLALETGGPNATDIIHLTTLAEDQTAADFIPAELYQRALAVLEAYFPNFLGIADNLHPLMWWMLGLEYIAIDQSNIDPLFGVEVQLMFEAPHFDLELIWIEYDNHYEFMEAMLNLPMELHLKMIENGLDVHLAAQNYNELYESWRGGDGDSLYNIWWRNLTFALSDELAAELYDVLLTHRDIRMANEASRLMAEGKNVFFSVGTMHLLGEDSIIDLLVQKGYTAERIRY